MGNSPGDIALKQARSRHGWSGGKGSRRRKHGPTVNTLITDLRWDYAFEKDLTKKLEIKQKLDELELEINNADST